MSPMRHCPAEEERRTLEMERRIALARAASDDRAADRIEDTMVVRGRDEELGLIRPNIECAPHEISESGLGVHGFDGQHHRLDPNDLAIGFVVIGFDCEHGRLDRYPAPQIVVAREGHSFHPKPPSGVRGKLRLCHMVASGELLLQ